SPQPASAAPRPRPADHWPLSLQSFCRSCYGLLLQSLPDLNIASVYDALMTVFPKFSSEKMPPQAAGRFAFTFDQRLTMPWPMCSTGPAFDADRLPRPSRSRLTGDGA